MKFEVNYDYYSTAINWSRTTTFHTCISKQRMSKFFSKSDRFIGCPFKHAKMSPMSWNTVCEWILGAVLDQFETNVRLYEGLTATHKILVPISVKIGQKILMHYRQQRKATGHSLNVLSSYSTFWFIFLNRHTRRQSLFQMSTRFFFPQHEAYAVNTERGCEWECGWAGHVGI